MKIANPQYFKTYSVPFTLKYEANGCYDATSILTTVLNQGSPAGFVSEHLIAHSLANYTKHAPASGYDLVALLNGKKIEIKGFNRNGVDLAPSKMKGTGRKFDREMFVEESLDKDFIVADTSNMPNHIEFIILPGSFVVNELPKNKITFGRRDALFATSNKATIVNWFE